VRRTLWNSLEEQADEVTRKWAMRDEAASETVRATLADAGLTLEGITARGMSVKLADFERLDRMITAVETRRYHALRELDKHRASLAQRLRKAIAEAEAAEFSGEAKPAPAPT
jgi:hypothetical protein